MRTNSIYLNRTNRMPANPSDAIARMAMEVRSCYNLLKMGYTTSCGVDLAKRALELQTKINSMSKKGNK